MSSAMWKTVLGGVLVAWTAVAAPVRQPMGALLESCGVRGGLIVHVGCGDGKETAKLWAGERFLVHGLDTDPANVAKARAHFRSLRVDGSVSAAVFDGERLPYAGNLVNVLLVSGVGCRVSNAEIERVLAPRGIAVVNPQSTISIPKSEVVAEWRVFRKPVPAELDEWTQDRPPADEQDRDTAASPGA